MHRVINAFKLALVVSWLMVAVCVVSEASASGTGSLNGTTIPSATYIIDSKGGMWTVSGGLIYEEGVLAGYSNAVTKLLYYNDTVYQENAVGGWWSWNGTTWVSSGNPTNATSPDGTSIPATAQIIDGNGNGWAVSGGVVYKNGALAGYSKAVTKLLYDNDTIYQENAVGGWWSWSGSTWVSSRDPAQVTSPDGTSVPASAQIIDGNGNVWTVSGGVIYEEGVLAGYSNAVTKLLYHNDAVYQENAVGGWWAWNGNTWVASGDPGANGVTAGSSSPNSASLVWTAPTDNTDGTPLTNLAGFRIYYGTNPAALTQRIQLANPSATSYVVRNLSAGNCYFTVAAYTAAGTESARSSQGYKAIP